MIYQARGNVLSAVYVFLRAGAVAAQVRVALHAARASASNLAHANVR